MQVKSKNPYETLNSHVKFFRFITSEIKFKALNIYFQTSLTITKNWRMYNWPDCIMVGICSKSRRTDVFWRQFSRVICSIVCSWCSQCILVKCIPAAIFFVVVIALFRLKHFSLVVQWIYKLVFYFENIIYRPAGLEQPAQEPSPPPSPPNLKITQKVPFSFKVKYPFSLWKRFLNKL